MDQVTIEGRRKPTFCTSGSWRRGFSSGKKTALVVSRVCWSACLVQAIHGHLCVPEL